MKVKVKRDFTKTETVDVDFPFYVSTSDSFDEGGGYQSSVRIDEDGTVHQLTRRYQRWNDGRGPFEYEFESRKIDLTESLGSYLNGRGGLTSSGAGDYNDLLAAFQRALGLFPN